ncbi:MULTISPECIES: hypothetical protein [unclassified Pseudomonas]|uniref:hypothetical protein n=1 Tax=unclassified Pseudomonas TaxID=196821 RepID=UPI0030DC5346
MENQTSPHRPSRKSKPRPYAPPTAQIHKVINSPNLKLMKSLSQNNFSPFMLVRTHAHKPNNVPPPGENPMQQKHKHRPLAQLSPHVKNKRQHANAPLQESTVKPFKKKSADGAPLEVF